MLKEQRNNKIEQKKDYSNVFNYFHNEYTQLLKRFLERHDVVIKEDDCLIDYIVKTRLFMPQYSSYTIPITNAMYNEEVPEDMKYSLLMNSYKIVKSAFEQ